MEKKNFFSESNILDLEELRQVAGGAGTETVELPPEEKDFILYCMKHYKDIGFTLEQTIKELKASKFSKDKKKKFEAFIRQEWANV